MTLPSRSESEAQADALRFEQSLRREDAGAKVIADARTAPGEEPQRFRGAKSKAEPTTPTEKQIVEALRCPLELGFVSNALLYSGPLRYLSTREKEALYKLVKGGAIEVVHAGPPSSYWLVTARYHANAKRHFRKLKATEPLKTEALVVVTFRNWQDGDDFNLTLRPGQVPTEVVRTYLARSYPKGVPPVDIQVTQRGKGALTENGGHFVWVTDARHRPLISDQAQGPYDFETAKTMARVAATKGAHDRVVSRGHDPESKSFNIVRGYRGRTGERFI